MSDYVPLAAQARVNLTGDATTPAGVRPTTIPAVTLRLIYDLDALAAIPVDPDIPPPPVGDPQKRRPIQPEEDSSSSDEEEEPQPGSGPRRQRRPLTRAERDRREIEAALAEDEAEDRLHASVPRGEFTAAEFVVEDLKNSDPEVLTANALRHTETLEEGSSLRQYISWILDYKRWAVDALPSEGDDLEPGSILTDKDEIGKHIGDDLGERWHTAPRQFIWLHGPRTNEPRIRAYVLFRARETLIEAIRSEEGNTAMRTQPIKPCTVNMLLGRIKALQMAARVEATLYKEKELHIMQDISVVRTEVRVMVRGKNKADNNVREITLADIFLYRLASGSSVNPDNRPMVMVIAQRNSKTCKDARLHHSYAARHLEAEQCAVGDTILWLHFIYDQVPQIFGVPIIPPLDVRRPELWYDKHLFFARYDKDQGLLPSSSQQRITRQLWTANKVFIKRNVHAARAGGAQELADQGTPRAEIAELGHWAIDKMTRSYITSIPVGVVMRKAGYSGARSDYFLGRSRLPPSADLEKTIAAHIFPRVEEQLGAAEELARGLEANTAAVHFIQTMLDACRIAAEDLAVKLVRTPWHPQVQASRLCRDRDFQAWAKDIEKIDTETIAKRRSPIPTQPAEISARLDAEFQVDLLNETLAYERHKATLKQMKVEKELEEARAAIAARDAEISRLMEELKISEARFIGRHNLLGKSSANAKQGEMRRMRRAMEAVRRFRSSDGEADTAAVIKKLDELVASGIVTFCDALKIIDADALPIRTEGNLGIKGLSKGEKPKLTVAWGLVAAGYMTHKWGEDMFPTTWEEQKAVAAEAAAGRPPPLPTKTSKRRKPG
ncbi:unnamed protein product [Closterium sp. NIES-64]|nr:unnamed protein product [Closterium sp. NIES-64]